MNLIRDFWDKAGIDEFYEFEKTLAGEKRDCEWEQRIINTKNVCYGRTSGKAREIVKEIKKGNFVQFIDNLKIKTHFDSIVVAFLVCKIKDFEMFEERLFRYAQSVDNWASCDTLKFEKYDKEKLIEISKKYLESEKPFVRRIGVNFFFEVIKDKKYLQKAFEVIDGLKNEKEYYVNMCASWLLCECFAKYRDETMKYFEKSKTNDFIINKAISKCRDSFRVKKEDKEELLRFKRKKEQ